MSQRVLTGVPEINWQILLNTDYFHLLRLCQSDSSLNSVCQNDDFWRYKTVHDYGPQQKPTTLTYRQLYESLRPMISLGQLKLSPLERLIRQVETGYRLNVATAIQFGRMDLLQWLIQNGVEPTDSWGYAAAGSGQTYILNWLLNLGLQPTVRWANEAAAHGEIEALDRLEQLYILPDSEGADGAVESDSVDSLDWLVERGIFPSGKAQPGGPDSTVWLLEHSVSGEE